MDNLPALTSLLNATYDMYVTSFCEVSKTIVTHTIKKRSLYFNAITRSNNTGSYSFPF